VSLVSLLLLQAVIEAATASITRIFFMLLFVFVYGVKD